MVRSDYINEILKQAANCDVVSFDVFDTLLMRPYAQPTDLFVHLEQLENMPGFAAERVRVEKRLHAEKPSGVEEVRFDDIYAAMDKKYAGMRDKELALEAQVLYADPEALELISQLAKQNKKIVAISDMYLPGAAIAEILKSKGFDAIEKVYCSSDFLKSKWSGNLFKIVFDDLNIHASKMLHIGDNEHADFKMARSSGACAFLWPQKKATFLGLSENIRLKSLCVNNPGKLAISITIGLAIRDWVLNKDQGNYWKKTGYIFGGPLCYGYTRFIIDEILKKRMDAALFVARDAWVLEKISDIIGGPEWNQVKKQYVYAQRIFNLATSLSHTDRLPSQLSSILTFFGRRIPALGAELPSSGLVPQDLGKELFEKYKSEIMEQSSKFSDEYKNYLDSFGIDAKKIALVDFSAMSFNSALLLQRMMPDKDFCGIYCLCAPAKKVKLDYTEYKNSDPNHPWFKEYNILEFFVTSPEHPVIDLKNGKPVYSDGEAEKCAAYAHMSEGEIQFAHDMCCVFGTNATRFMYSDIVSIIDTFTENATKQDVENFEKITFSADEAGRDIIKFNIKAPEMDFSMTEQEKETAGLVSVIIPVYNCKQYLARSVGSLLGQTYKNIEVICVNDGSKDDSLDELNRLAAMDPRVKVISQKNSGPATARNAGLGAARGKWLMFCDSDDWYDSDAVEQMLGAMLANDADIVSADNRVVWEDGKKFKDRVAATECQKLKIIGNWQIDKLDNALYYTGAVLWGRMLRMDKIRQYDIRFPDGYEHDDTAFMTQCYAVMEKMFCLDRIVYNYVIRNNSIMDQVYKRKNSGKELDTYYSTYKLFDFLNKNNFFSDYNCLNFLHVFHSSLSFAFSYLDKIDQQVKALDLYRDLLNKFGFDKLEQYKSEYFYGILSLLAAGNYSGVLRYLNITPTKCGNSLWMMSKKTGRVSWHLLGIPVLVKKYKDSGIKWRLFNIITVKRTGKLKSDKAADHKKTTIGCIDPVFDNAVTVFMATNNNYAPNCAVMVQSIKDHANPARNYDIVISTSDMVPEYKNMLKSMGTSNVSVRLIDAKEFTSGIDTSLLRTTLHFSQDAYFRFFIPKIFEKYAKVLYLDVDMVALHDVAELFDQDIGDNWWGVTHEACISTIGAMKSSWEYNTFLPYIRNTLQITNTKDYFQSGVMVWNVRQCIKDDVTQKCMERLAKIGQPIYVDQCVMSSLANGEHISFIDDKWNVVWDAPFHWAAAQGTQRYQKQMVLLKNPYILHYASGIKPWNEPYRENAHNFWEIARRTPFYEILLCNFVNGAITHRMNNGVNIGPRKNIHKIKRKIAKYKFLQFITFGTVKSFKQRKANWKQELMRG